MTELGQRADRVVTLNDRTGTQRDLKSVEVRVKSHRYLLGISGKS